MFHVLYIVENRCTVVDERLKYVIPQVVLECTEGTGDMVTGDAITGAEGTELPKFR